ncbi:hypothetical protein PK28_10185 [Hymenobacter sp. DG25B]|uniref:hypothetical protein n=1 Tax=Hymenobacter sp. DG25B TaxID=1385664 RepID=UPI000540C8E4|nr:hypothetical protein [Hymenobacter sp. DG25B]AIZ63963.1 hypothetical protein PK28_10185 [Hymenobacter sp. DG25B]
MPKTIDYPRTSYDSAWEVAEIVDDTGGKCAIEMAARKLNRKVSGSFKAIIGSAVKFGLLTSKREILTTTNLFRRIKHAYDKREEKIYHREAFLHPPLFTQICRKFRNRELPVHMLDVMLIREFNVEEINAQGVAKAFLDGARMVDILDERNVVADIDQLAAQQGPRRELSAGEMPMNLFKADTSTQSPGGISSPSLSYTSPASLINSSIPGNKEPAAFVPSSVAGGDAISQLFGLDIEDMDFQQVPSHTERTTLNNENTTKPGEEYPTPPAPAREFQSAPSAPLEPSGPPAYTNAKVAAPPVAAPSIDSGFRILISGPGIHTELSIQDADDLLIVNSLIEKIRRQVSR